ncbi:hypothetical protein AOLI_G00122680 [Acnodon oligacanthus]
MLSAEEESPESRLCGIVFKVSGSLNFLRLFCCVPAHFGDFSSEDGRLRKWNEGRYTVSLRISFKRLRMPDHGRVPVSRITTEF